MILAEVIWEDIIGDSSVRGKDEVKRGKPELVHTFGLIVKKTARRLVLASTEYEDGDLGDTNVIPRGCISKINIIDYKQTKLKR